MKTSTYILSTSQKWIFLVVITMAILFAGCSDSPTGESRDTVSFELPANDLEGYWIELSNKGKKDIAWLNLTSTSGTYEAFSADNNNIVMNFEYEKVDGNQLHITMTMHTVNGTVQPTGGEEDIFYRLSGNTLRIFDRNFIRSENHVDVF